MLKLASDADVNGDIIKGLLGKVPGLNVLRVHDVGLRTADDPTILAWAAAAGRM